MDAYKRFHQLIKRDFAPLLRSNGFKGSGTTFRRFTGERIDVVNLQGSAYGGKCCVNLGVQFSFLLQMSGTRIVDPKKIKEYECTFRDRLAEAGASDHWWSYGNTEDEAESSIASLVELYRQRGEAYFARFEPFPGVFEQVTPQDADAGDFSKMPIAMSGIQTILTLARIMNHIGRREKCREFAEVGLRHLGRAVGLKDEFERLRDLE